MNITKQYIKDNYSFTETSVEKLENLLKSRNLNVSEYIIVEIGYIYYATHKECFTLDYYTEYKNYSE